MQAMPQPKQRVATQVLLEEGHDDSTRQEPVTITGLSENGYLSAIDADGKTIELHPDGNRCEADAALLSISDSH